MKGVKIGFPAAALVCYLTLFAITDQYFREARITIQAPLPAVVQRVALGFLRHLGAELLYVKAAVFLGAHPDLRPKEEESAEALRQNFDVLTELYPEFKDGYYLAQSSLAHISPEYAGHAITLLDRGVAAYPDDLILPFFQGFNHYYYRDEASHAAEIFAELAKHPEAPSWLGHLAAVLSARDGELYAGLLSLQVMHATEEDEYSKARYARDIEIFKQAIGIQEATKAYAQKYGQPPRHLNDLVPEYFSRLPDIGSEFELLWIPPRLRLLRPLK
ncbi:MAG: hypothetical protein FDZ69_01570 [Deltaproteobacteria bacterium]|nr:MAG: hypothetical protein FDZ69_01570 [Deltaproteobacteria bacterium]